MNVWLQWGRFIPPTLLLSSSSNPVGDLSVSLVNPARSENEMASYIDRFPRLGSAALPVL